MELVERAKGIEVSTVEKDPLISTMPEHIIHEILSRLSMLDVARTSCLSKQWNNFCVSFPCLNIDQSDFNHLPFHHFKNTMLHKVMSIKEEEERLVIHKFRLRMHFEYVQNATKEIEECTRLVLQTSTVKEFDFQIMHHCLYATKGNWCQLFHHIYNAKTFVVLRLSGLTLIQPSDRDIIKFSHLEILRLENVWVKRENVIDWLFTSCPLIREISLVRCNGLKHLKVCGNLGHLKQLEVVFCQMLESVEIQVPSLEKLVLSEIERRRGTEFCMALRIDSETSETLRELTLCNSTIGGLTFTRLFSRCSKVESLVLERCIRFFKIKIASQKLRKLVVKRCYDLVVTDIEATNLTSFMFCNYVPNKVYQDFAVDKQIQYCEEISQLQECLLDFNKVLMSKNIWTYLWFDKFNYSADQKMIIYPLKNYKGYDVVVLEDWSSMAELTLMTQISESSSRTTITTMSFLDLASYVFGDCGKGLKGVLAISISGKSMLHERPPFKGRIWQYDHHFSVVRQPVHSEQHDLE
ncbi:hypothetical protein JHK87_021781 [Glycine soja]|nr:hypothetical protein JHK87_021781 [Glycine soja]